MSFTQLHLEYNKENCTKDKTDNLDIGKKKKNLLAHFSYSLFVVVVACYLLWKNFYFLTNISLFSFFIFCFFSASFCFFFVSLDCWYFRLLSFSNFLYIFIFSFHPTTTTEKTFYFSFQFKQISYSKRNPQQFAWYFFFYLMFHNNFFFCFFLFCKTTNSG